MLLWVPLWDSVVRYGSKASMAMTRNPEVAVELKAKVEAKFHMHCFVLC
jgi:hypothetical protein